MKPAPFDYVRASSLAEALEWLACPDAGAQILAGGQSLILALNMRLSAPARLIDINGIAALAGIVVRDDVLRIGALTRHAELERSALVREHAPLLSLAAPHIAHPAIRNRGTIGGSLALADPAAELPAAMVALGATLLLARSGGERRMPANEFFKGVYQTALEPQELVLGCEIPLARLGARSAFAELSRRQGDYALAGLAAQAERAGRRFNPLRLVYFGLGTRPVEAAKAAGILTSRGFGPETLRAAQEALAQDLDPQDDLASSAAMKRHLARVLLGRVVGDLIGEDRRS